MWHISWHRERSFNPSSFSCAYLTVKYLIWHRSWRLPSRWNSIPVIWTWLNLIWAVTTVSLATLLHNVWSYKTKQSFTANSILRAINQCCLIDVSLSFCVLVLLVHTTREAHHSHKPVDANATINVKFLWNLAPWDSSEQQTMKLQSSKYIFPIYFSKTVKKITTNPSSMFPWNKLLCA